jgi:hypothetical protein
MLLQCVCVCVGVSLTGEAQAGYDAGTGAAL